MNCHIRRVFQRGGIARTAAKGICLTKKPFAAVSGIPTFRLSRRFLFGNLAWIIILTLLLCQTGRSAVDEPASNVGRRWLEWPIDHLSIAAGPAILMFNGLGSPALAGVDLRYMLGREAPWFVEAGVILPNTVSGKAIRIDNTTAAVGSFSEAHIAAHYQWPLWPLLSFDAGFGVSASVIKTNFDTVPLAISSLAGSADESKISFSPLFQAGLTLLPRSRISLSFDAAYVSYANTVSSRGAMFDLGLTGWMLRPTIQIRL
jgi:hypothetical protein